MKMQAPQLKEISNPDYLPDVLGEGFSKLNLPLASDYEGEAIATLIRRKAESNSSKAILYIHGFNDYFFQSQMAKRFNLKGFNFYALDLRKYGRSYLKHQKLNNVRSLLEYDEEIETALTIIKSENNTQVILKGHSNGGLILTNYAERHKNSTLFHGIICNSPFYEFNLSFLEREIGIPFLAFLGKYFPDRTIPSGFAKEYGYSLHKDKYGEWNYSTTWKPFETPDINLGFIRAIHTAQKNIQNSPSLHVPILVMHSDKTIYEKKWSEKFTQADAVLNVNHIRKYAQKIKGHLTVCEIENGLHDLFLSKKKVREEVYSKVFEWIENNI
ncbi:alpha/beta hydrolase [Flavicella sediminum]|uniref:alpha/beta hydrolase n=1 Tax=Flavicella sediminum TaxID=2585141 RepID=UPI001AA01BCC|nr:alpha/beta hydrolase [Flavicella sediminum]